MKVASLASLLLALSAAACGPKPAPAPPAKQFTPSTRAAEEITGCGQGCDRIGACWEAGWGEPMSDDQRASCESTCLTATPEDGDAWMAAVGAETDCAKLVEL